MAADGGDEATVSILLGCRRHGNVLDAKARGGYASRASRGSESHSFTRVRENCRDSAEDRGRCLCSCL